MGCAASSSRGGERHVSMAIRPKRRKSTSDTRSIQSTNSVNGPTPSPADPHRVRNKSNSRRSGSRRSKESQQRTITSQNDENTANRVPSPTELSASTENMTATDSASTPDSTSNGDWAISPPTLQDGGTQPGKKKAAAPSGGQGKRKTKERVHTAPAIQIAADNEGQQRSPNSPTAKPPAEEVRENDNDSALWMHDGYGEGPYPIFTSGSDLRPRAAREGTSADNYTFGLLSPLSGEDTLHNKQQQQQQHQQQQVLQQQMKMQNVRMPSQRPPVQSQQGIPVMWRRPPMPPPALKTAPEPQAVPASSSPESNTPISASSVQSAGTAAAAASSNGSHDGADGVISATAVTAPKKTRKRAQVHLRATPQQRLPNLGSILGPSPGLPEHPSTSPPPISSAKTPDGHSSVTSVEIVKPRRVPASVTAAFSPTPRLSMAPSVSPGLRGGVNASMDSSSSAAASTAPYPSVETMLSISPAASMVQREALRPSDGSHNSRSGAGEQEFETFMEDFVESMTPSATTGNAKTKAQVKSPVAVVRVLPAEPPAPRAPSSPPSTATAQTSAATRPARPAVLPISLKPASGETTSDFLRDSSDQYAENILGTSLLILSPPGSPGLEEDRTQSPMNSPTELFLPYARNLRPTQWQCASLLHKKIEEKVLEKSGDRQLSQPQSQRRLLSDVTLYSLPGRPSSAVRTKQVSRIPANTAGAKKVGEGASSRVEAAEDEDLYGYSYFSFTSAVQLSTARRAASPSLPNKETPVSTNSAAMKIKAATEGKLLSVAPPSQPARAASTPQPSKQPQPPPQQQLLTTAVVTEKLGERNVSRMPSIMSGVSSVFTDDGYLLLNAHVSDFYREDLSFTGDSSSGSTSNSFTNDDDAFKPMPAAKTTSVTTSSAANTQLPPKSPQRNERDRNNFATAAALSGADGGAVMSTAASHPILSKRVFAGRNDTAAGEQTAMPRVPAAHAAVSPRRWNSVVTPTADRRHQILQEQRRRLLHEQQLYTRQLKNQALQQQQQQQPSQMPAAREAPVSPFKGIADRRNTASLTPDLHGVSDTVSPTTSKAPASPKPTTPQPLSRAALAMRFFAAEEPQLNIPHTGTTARGDPQPDIKYGPFVATDKSRRIDFEKALGFGLKDVPAIQSPTWDSLPPPELNEDSEEL